MGNEDDVPPHPLHLKLVSNTTTTVPVRDRCDDDDEDLAVVLVHLQTCRALLEAFDQAVKTFNRIGPKIVYAEKHMSRADLTREMMIHIKAAAFLWHQVQYRMQNIASFREDFEELTLLIISELKHVRGEARSLGKIAKYLSEEVKQHRASKKAETGD